MLAWLRNLLRLLAGLWRGPRPGGVAPAPRLGTSLPGGDPAAVAGHPDIAESSQTAVVTQDPRKFAEMAAVHPRDPRHFREMAAAHPRDPRHIPEMAWIMDGEQDVRYLGEMVAPQLHHPRHFPENARTSDGMRGQGEATDHSAEHGRAQRPGGRTGGDAGSVPGGGHDRPVGREWGGEPIVADRRVRWDQWPPLAGEDSPVPPENWPDLLNDTHLWMVTAPAADEPRVERLERELGGVPWNG